MKKLIGLMALMFFGLADLNAMSYEEARDRARYLTDKMAYELNLNDQQYNDAYEINLDYLMNIQTANDVSGVYLTYRNADMRCILYDWQFELFEAASYFFRPVIWRAAGWFLPVYTIYSATRFFFDPPRMYISYRGGHYKYHLQHRKSYYAERRPAWNGGLRGANRISTTSRTGLNASRGGNGFRIESNGNASGQRQQTSKSGNNGFRLETNGNNDSRNQASTGTNNVQQRTNRSSGNGVQSQGNRSQSQSTRSQSNMNRSQNETSRSKSVSTRNQSNRSEAALSNSNNGSSRRSASQQTSTSSASTHSARQEFSSLNERGFQSGTRSSSNYNRPSSTRTTVNTSSVGTRSQSAQSSVSSGMRSASKAVNSATSRQSTRSSGSSRQAASSRR